VSGNICASTICATLLLREGVNAKVVSEVLGHASITVTLNTYSHVLPDMQDSAVDAMEAALGTIS
jgi:integrase